MTGLAATSTNLMFTLTMLAVTVFTASIPYIIRHVSARFPDVALHKSYDWLPVIAAFCFIVAFFLPDIHISSDTSTFQQHFVGGGIYCTLLFVYVRKLLDWNWNWFLGLIVLFAWTSAFGVANEILEFTLTKLHILSIDTSDTDWDLLANTSGSLLTYFVYLVAKYIRSH